MHTKPHSAESKRKMSLASKGKPKPWLQGKKLSLEHRKKLSEAKKGKPSWNKGLQMWWTPARMTGKIPWNKGTKGEYGTTKKGKKQPNVSQEKHWAWKGGITPINRAIRNSLETKLWREAVFERDKYTCVWCGARNGNGTAVTLHADHIKQFAYFPELRFAIDNGRTLCKPCHKKTDTFAKKQ